MESERPNPVTRSPQLPAIPITHIQNRFLYRNILRIVTLVVNPSLFQMKPTCSSRTRFPGFGAFGRIRDAGTSCNAENVTNAAASVTLPTIMAMERAARSGQYCT